MIGPCRLFLLLLISINAASGVYTPPPSPPRNAGKRSAGSPLYLPPKTHKGAYDPNRRDPTYVSSYTITQPHSNGRSISSEQYSGKKIVDPVVHGRYTPAQPKHLRKIIKSYHVDRSMDVNKYKKEKQRHSTAMAALEEISNGNVVRHVGKGQTLLLHHDGISPEHARYLAENDFAVDWTRTAEGYDIEPTQVQKEYRHSKTVPQHLSEAEKAAMHARLDSKMQEARQHSLVSKEAQKLYWNWEKQRAMPDRKREAELANEKFIADEEDLLRPEKEVTASAPSRGVRLGSHRHPKKGEEGQSAGSK